VRKHVQRIERIALLLVGLATVASLVFWDGRIVLGVGVGGALAALNFHALRRIMAAIFNAEGTSGQKQAFTAVLLLFKFGALALTVFLVVKFAPVDAVAFMVGISVVVLSIFIEGFRIMLRGPTAQSE